VKACMLPASEWEAVVKQQGAKPGEPLTYANEPEWQDLPKVVSENPTKAVIRLKPDETGMVRVSWVANKIGPELRLKPKIIMRGEGDPAPYQLTLEVPVVVRQPIQFDTDRVHVGVLTAGKSISKVFDAWSSTRSKLDLQLVSTDPLFVFDVKPLVDKDLEAKKDDLRTRKLSDHVLCAYQITVTVHESMAGKYLDQGSFYRKFAVALDGKEPDPNSPVYAPEIVGRTKGDIGIGGEDDRGRVRFAPFTRATGGTAEVQLSTGPNVDLKTYDGHPNQPSFIKVNLTRDEKQASATRVTWQLEVTVPPNTLAARTFDEPDAVVLSIGRDRFVRIPIEGQISR
jgi:hypothetical protein